MHIAGCYALNLILMCPQEIMEIPEVYALEFALFRGHEVKLFKDGSFMIDGVKCSGPVYNGVENC